MENIYYLNLIPSQYRLQPKFMKWLEAGIQKLQDSNSTAQEIISNFDLDTATGVQLDIIGKLIGRSRQLDFRPRTEVSSILDDTSYRLLLKAKMVWNQWKGTLPELYNAWQEIFPNGNLLILDNQDMSMDVIVSGDFSVLEKDLIYNGLVVPKPEGVRINYLIIAQNADMPIFSYGYDNGFLGGYTTNWIKEETSLIFGYKRSVSYG